MKTDGSWIGGVCQSSCCRQEPNINELEAQSNLSNDEEKRETSTLIEQGIIEDGDLEVESPVPIQESEVDKAPMEMTCCFLTVDP